MLEAILYFVAGFILCDFLVYLRFKKAKKASESVDDTQLDTKKIFIEYHSDCFFAYSDDNEFLAQDTSLSDLVLRVMQNDPSVIVAANDEFVISEMKKLVASSQQ